jgi:bacillithiol synthase
MKLEKIDLEEANCFSSIFLDYINQDEKLKPFFHHYPSLENFKKQIEAKSSFESRKRKALQEVLNQQYQGLEKSARFTENLKLLEEEKTFTVTTGHQLNIFTGPLYFIYKIVTTINLASKLKDRYPDHNFIPVYWMASEDHDFAEINHFRLFNQEYKWQTEQKGAVGRFGLEGMKQLTEELPELLPVFERAYLNQDNLSDASRYIANELFGAQGLMVVDADYQVLKSEFSEIMRQDIVEENSNHLVEATSEKLSQAGYRNQVFSRKINFFYLDENIRGRLVRENSKFEVLDTDLKFSEEELEKIIKETPEKLSPNVITRPLYQEVILPNIAYIGGPAEVAYWLQLKEVFQHYQVPFPIVMPRNFALVVNKSSTKKLYKLAIKPADLFIDQYQLKERYILQNGEGAYQLSEQKKKLKQLFAEIVKKAELTDKSLTGVVGSEQSKAEKILDNLEKRLKKAEENNQEVALRQVEKLKEKLFPEGSLQERKDNFLNFYLNDRDFLKKLIDKFNPLDYRFNVLIEE